MKGLMDRWGQNDTTIRHAYHKAEFELRKSKRVDYYQLLGCRKLSSEGEIKQAYKAKAMECHPDKHAGEPPALIKQMEEKFKLLGEALEILTTPMKRQLYDEGYALPCAATCAASCVPRTLCACACACACAA